MSTFASINRRRLPSDNGGGPAISLILEVPVCGRVVVSQLKGLIESRILAMEFPSILPHFNIAPTGQGVTVQADWQARMMRWGLIPSWAKDPAIGAKTFNARWETVAEKPSFRSAFKASRCLIPVNGFYEWLAVGKTKTPFFISNADPEEMLIFAGLWETWRSPEGFGLHWRVA